MDEKDKQNLAVSAEEQKAEEEAKKEVNEDELRSKVSEEYGLDQDEDKELLDKLVAKEKLQHEKLSGAIKQRISWREKYLSPTISGYAQQASSFTFLFLNY
jgi:hypothetical protein